MTETKSAMQLEIVEFIRDSFSASGVSVTSYGRGNVVVELPADFPGISSMIRLLSDTFDAECDLTTVGRSPQLTIWYPEMRRSVLDDDENEQATQKEKQAAQVDIAKWTSKLPRPNVVLGIIFFVFVILGFFVTRNATVVWSSSQNSF